MKTRQHPLVRCLQQLVQTTIRYHDWCTEWHDMTGALNDMTGALNDTTGALNDMTGALNDMTSALNDTTGALNDMMLCWVLCVWREYQHYSVPVWYMTTEWRGIVCVSALVIECVRVEVLLAPITPPSLLPPIPTNVLSSTCPRYVTKRTTRVSDRPPSSSRYHLPHPPHHTPCAIYS